jgi:hypothetical protein
MKVEEEIRRIAQFLAVALAMSGCEWTELDAIAPGVSQARDASSSEDVADASTEARAATDASKAPRPDAASSVACTRADATVYQWTFDSSVQAWALVLDTGVTGSLAWTDNTGMPSPGALKVEITPKEEDGGATNGGWLQYPHAFGDLSGRTVSAWVWLDRDESSNLKVFAQTGSQYVWSDNGTVSLVPRAWTCVSLPISNPSYTQPNYDPTDVINIGFELLGTAPFHVYVDSVSIY